jgi:hypothetical protein
MSKGKKEVAQEKEARKQITERLHAALSDLKEALGEKKFETRVKKAVKVLAKDVIVKMNELDEYEETISEDGTHTEVLSEDPNPVKKAPKKAAAPKKAPAPKKAAAKKDAAKKEAPKKEVSVSKDAPARKAAKPAPKKAVAPTAKAKK